MDIWPNFFIVGAPRAGTTTLYDFLKRTKGVCMSSKKEPHYFSNINPSFLYPIPIRNKKKYLSLFKISGKDKAIGEASTSYLVDPESACLIHKTISNAKIIIILRNPVERAFSHYLLRISGGKVFSFSEAIKESLSSNANYYQSIITKGSLYFEAVKRYYDIFGENQVKILIFEEFIKNTKNIVKDVLDFLGIDADPPDSVDLVHNYPTKPKGKLSSAILTNKMIRNVGRKALSESTAEYIVRVLLGKKVTKPKISKEDGLFLKNLFKEDIQKLQKLVKRKFPWSFEI